MERRKQLWGAAAFAGMLVLILDGKTAVQGGYEGIILCLKTVIPSLFPFFVLSNLIMSAFTGSSIRLLRPLANLCSLPGGMESLFIPAFLGGYPVGAQTIAQVWRDGQISKEEAERLLGFCNNAGPSFLFGMAAVMFPKRWMAWMLWAVHLISAILTAQLIAGEAVSDCVIGKRSLSLPAALQKALNSMGSVCGWVVFFRVMIAFLNRWVLWLFPRTIQVLLIGLLELSNGCMSLLDIQEVGLRFIICSGMLAFGGFCVMMQVASAVQGLSLKWFFCGKLIQTTISLGLSWALVSKEPIVFGFLMLLVPLFFMRSRKNGSIPDKAGV